MDLKPFVALLLLTGFWCPLVVQCADAATSRDTVSSHAATSRTKATLRTATSRPSMANLLTELPFDSVDIFRIESSTRSHEFSGLTIAPSGDLFTISDNVWDSAIYRIEIDKTTGDRARCIPLSVDTKALGQRAFDWEGIGCLDDQTFFLLNERGDGNNLSCRIAKVRFPKGKSRGVATWYTPSLLEEACRLCLSPIEPNKSLEGICLMGKREPLRFLLAFERVERAILYLGNQSPTLVKVLEEGSQEYEVLFRGHDRGSASFSGLAFEEPDKLFVLVRNCSALAKFSVREAHDSRSVKEADDDLRLSLNLESLWSFAHVLKGRGLWNWWNAPKDKEPYGYGMAEGVCVDDKFVYIIFDTQNCFSPKGTKDYRTPLLRFRRPDRLW